MKDFREYLPTLPLPGRFALCGGLAAAFVGAVAGLIVGLHVHPATAWFAVFELGFPAGILGALAGGVVGCVVAAVAAVARRFR
jgi:hypothetical protein